MILSPCTGFKDIFEGSTSGIERSGRKIDLKNLDPADVFYSSREGSLVLWSVDSSRTPNVYLLSHTRLHETLTVSVTVPPQSLSSFSTCLYHTQRLLNSE